MKEKINERQEIKMSKQPPPAPTASAVGPCPTIIQTSRTPGTGSLPRTIAKLADLFIPDKYASGIMLFQERILLSLLSCPFVDKLYFRSKKNEQPKARFHVELSTRISIRNTKNLHGAFR